jgi:hypothetical protein
MTSFRLTALSLALHHLREFYFAPLVEQLPMLIDKVNLVANTLLDQSV